jgi:nitrite reductase/ring-hydroxylating ferredoxin subunit
MEDAPLSLRGGSPPAVVALVAYRGAFGAVPEIGDPWVTVAKADEIPSMSMKHFEYQGIEFSIINVGGQYFAVSDRCGHMNAPLSRGRVSASGARNIVVCPLHSSTYDVATGKNLSGPVRPPPMDVSGVPKPVVDTLARAAEISAAIKVHDLDSFEVERQGDEIRLNVAPRKVG